MKKKLIYNIITIKTDIGIFFIIFSYILRFKYNNK